MLSYCHVKYRHTAFRRSTRVPHKQERPIVSDRALLVKIARQVYERHRYTTTTAAKLTTI